MRYDLAYRTVKRTFQGEENRMENRHTVSKAEVSRMNTEELRANFLVPNLFNDGRVSLVHSHQDRVILGGVVPTDGPLKLEAPAELRAEYFLQRRELGVIVVQGTGVVAADGERHELPKGGCIYVGRGVREVWFESVGDEQAKFYLFSAPAHTSYPTQSVQPGQGDVRELGDQEHANRRSLNRYIHVDGIKSCQIVMGLTRLHSGSMWNTMPAHTHDRRMEATLPRRAAGRPGAAPDGEPQTRHLVVANHEAVISRAGPSTPGWAPRPTHSSGRWPGEPGLRRHGPPADRDPALIG